MLKIIKPTIISVCFFSSLAYATESESTPKDEIKYSSPTILQVEQIQAETVIYEAKLARQKAVSELRNLASATPAITPSSGYSSLADTDIPAQRVAAKSLRVIEIFGTPQQMSARISLLDGSVTDVKVGQSIPGTSYKVASITGNGVWIQNGTEKRQLIL
ncbi:type IV pilus biogenesis protein PilP [Escherichia coli]